MLKETNSDKFIYPILEHFFQSYMTERNIEKTLSLVTDDIYSLGTGDNEIAVNKEQFAALLKQEIALIPDPIVYRIRDYTEKQLSDGCWECFCNMETSIEQHEDHPVWYCTRFTGTFRLIGGRYLADSLHMSEASSSQENEEFFPLRFISDHSQKMHKQAQRELLDILCEMMPSGIIGGYIEKGFPLYVVNDAMLSMLGYTYDEFVEDTGGMVINSIHEDDMKRVSEHVFQCMETGTEYMIEYRVRKKDKSFMWVHDIGRKIVSDDGRDAIISVLFDISSDIQIRHQLREESSRDSLTGVYNRRGGKALVDYKMKTAQPYAFFMMDIDNFKQINDLYGHRRGDHMLQHVANTLKNTFRQTDVIIRMGGDEFAVLAYPCTDSEAVQAKFHTITEKYLEEARVHCHGIQTSISAGGLFSYTAMPFEELYKISDDILYNVKQTKKGSCIILEKN